MDQNRETFHISELPFTFPFSFGSISVREKTVQIPDVRDETSTSFV
jgi:hypothetical protein